MKYSNTNTMEDVYNLVEVTNESIRLDYVGSKADCLKRQLKDPYRITVIRSELEYINTSRDWYFHFRRQMIKKVDSYRVNMIGSKSYRAESEAVIRRLMGYNYINGSTEFRQLQAIRNLEKGLSIQGK